MNSPRLNSHIHCQAAQSSRTNQSLPKSVAAPTHGRKKKINGAQQHLYVIPFGILRIAKPLGIHGRQHNDIIKDRKYG